MKKILFLLVITLLTLSCNKSTPSDPATPDVPSTPDDPKTPDTVYTEITYLCGEYAGPLDTAANSPEYYQFMFGANGISLDEEGYFEGSGTVYLFSIFAPSKGTDFFPANGIYIGNDSLTANTFYCTTKSTANGFAAIYTIKDCEIEDTKTIRILSGKITISGNTTNSDFAFAVNDAKSNSHFLHFAGPAPIEIVE